MNFRPEQARWNLALVLIASLLIWVAYPIVIAADVSIVLRPIADGGDDSANWTNTAGTACNTTGCYLAVDESAGSSCTDSDGDTSYITSSTQGANQTFAIDESSIPNNAIITQITVTTCDKTAKIAAQIQTRMCVDGICTNSGINIIPGFSYAEHSQAYVVNFTKTADTDIEIGVSNTALKEATRVSQISAIITYTPPDTTAPAAVTDLTASDATASSIDVSWTAPGDDGSSGTATSYDIRHSTSAITEGNWASATQVTGEPSPSVAGSSESMTVSGLDSDTTYYFAIKTSDEVPNESDLSNVPSVATLDVTAPVISNISSGTPGETSATITWNTDEASTSQVAYGQTTSYGSQTTLDADLVTSHSVTITGLTRGTTYHFHVKSKDASDNEAVSGDNSFITTVLPAPVISNISSSNIKQTEAVITWTTDTASTSQVEYGLTTDYGSRSILGDTFVTAHSVSLAGLEAATLYHFRVKSKDAAGKEAISTDQTFTTKSEEEVIDEEPPLAISDVTTSTITDSQATITWTTNKEATSQVLYGTTSGSYPNVTDEITVPVTSHSITLHGLSSRVTYYYIVKSNDTEGNEAISGEKSFITASSAPASPGAPGTTTPIIAPGETATERPILPTERDKIPPEVYLSEISPNPTNNQKPIITGTAVDTDGVIASLAISLDNGITWHPATTVAGLGTSEAVFTYVPQFLEDGDFPIKARARDNSDNEGFSETQTLVIDLLPPIFGGKKFLIGHQAAPISKDGVVNSVVGMTQKMVISAKGGPTTMTILAQSQTSKEQDQVFDLHYVESQNLWAGELIFTSSGVFDLTLTAEDGSGNVTTQILNSFFIQKAGGVIAEETNQPVAQARVALYQRHPVTKQWVLWPADAFGQQNPQITVGDGGYQFFAPPGQYYLEVVKEGYRQTVSQIILLEKNSPISGDVFLSKKSGFHLGPASITFPSWFIFAKSEAISLPTSTQGLSSQFFMQFIGKQVPELTLFDSNAGENRLFDQRGKKVVISVWNTWDSQSQKQLPILDHIAEQNMISTVIFPLVLQESPSKVQTYLKRGGYTIVSLVDPTGIFATSLPVVSVPQHFFIDRTGVLRDVYVGFLDTASLIQKINEL